MNDFLNKETIKNELFVVKWHGRSVVQCKE